MAVPNGYQTVVDVANRYPREFQEAHTGGPNTELWIRLLAYELHTKVDRRFGLNGKRATDTLSQDAICFRGEGPGHEPNNGNSPASVFDVIRGAGGPNPTPSWDFINQAGPCKWIQPQAVPGYHDNPVQPLPPVQPPVEPPQFVDLTQAVQQLTQEVAKNSQAVRELSVQEAQSRDKFAQDVKTTVEGEIEVDIVLIDELRKTQAVLTELVQLLRTGFTFKAKGSRFGIGDVNGELVPKG